MKPRQIGKSLSARGPASVRGFDGPRNPAPGSRRLAESRPGPPSGTGPTRRPLHRGTRSRTIRPEGKLILSARERDTVAHLDAALREWRAGWVEVSEASLVKFRKLVTAVMQQGRWSGRRTLERGFLTLGYDRLLLSVAAFGQLTPEGVDVAYVRMREVAQTDPKGNLIKAGFLAFDGLARRLAEVCGTLVYSVHDNAPRDRLHALANLFVR